ncbi:MAG TPA: Wzz/FepE/Etk N-terminal domain-containing protein [Dehalococcoidia bacterium]|nr:Wzz/FepE/Etk N-terminal domain-containing protein [Dehalococcoidia bacterium]
MNDESRLQFERYLQLVNRRKFVLLIPLILAVSGAALLSYFTKPVYTATATARVDISASGIDVQDPNAASRFLNTYSFIIKTTPFLTRVVQDLQLKVDPNTLANKVGTKPIAGTELMSVTAQAGNAQEAAAIANDLANLLHDPTFISQTFTSSTPALTTELDNTQAQLQKDQAALTQLQTTGGSASAIAAQQAVVNARESAYQALLNQLSAAQVKQGQAARAFSVIEPAEPPAAPTSPRWKFNLAAGLLAGLVAGIALSLVLEYVDPTLRGVRDLESVTRLPVLASIPFGIRWKYPPPPVSPDYRLLATKLQTSLQENKRHSVLFTSARPDEGNTTVATYSAMAMAQAGLRVLLVDANLNRPDLHKLFNIPLSPGLYTFISTNGVRPVKPLAEAAPEAIQQSPVPRLSVLTAGTKMSDPSELLASAEMRQFLDYLETQWDVVVIDGPSMSTSAGSAVIAPVVDGVVLVAAEGQASSKSVEETLSELLSLGAHSMGLVYCKATEA